MCKKNVRIRICEFVVDCKGAGCVQTVRMKICDFVELLVDFMRAGCVKKV